MTSEKIPDKIAEQRKEALMKNSLLFLWVLLALFFVPPATAEEVSQGEQLVRDLWKNVREGNWSEIEKGMLPEFQSVHEDIARNVTEEIELLKGLNLDKYELSYFKTTQTDSLILVSYRVMTEQTIANIDLPARAAMRLSGWVKTPEGWKWALHANLNPLRPLEPEPLEPAEQVSENKPKEKPVVPQ